MSSRVIDKCQICQSTDLHQFFNIGYLPPVNTLIPIGKKQYEETWYPTALQKCEKCSLVQIGCEVAPYILFPNNYAYTSGTTKLLRDNFAELAKDTLDLFPEFKGQLVCDVGSNDGTLLEQFKKLGCRVVGIEPTDVGEKARAKGIPTITSFLRANILRGYGYEKAKIVTACNVFAHIPNLDYVMDCILEMLDTDGLFITESSYLLSLLNDLNFDTIYHEHLRFYSVTSLKYLFNIYGLEIIHVKKIPTHGGSIRVIATRKGTQHCIPDMSVPNILHEEKDHLSKENLDKFRNRVSTAKLELMSILASIKREGKSIYGVGLPSRAVTFLHYYAIDETILEGIFEIPGSQKIGMYVPGMMLPVLNEDTLLECKPDYLLLLSWHLADELIPKIKSKGYTGRFVVPLPTPEVI